MTNTIKNINHVTQFKNRVASQPHSVETVYFNADCEISACDDKKDVVYTVDVIKTATLNNKKITHVTANAKKEPFSTKVQTFFSRIKQKIVSVVNAVKNLFKKKEATAIIPAKDKPDSVELIENKSDKIIRQIKDLTLQKNSIKIYTKPSTPAQFEETISNARKKMLLAEQIMNLNMKALHVEDKITAKRHSFMKDYVSNYNNMHQIASYIKELEKKRETIVK